MLSDRGNPFATRFVLPGQTFVEPPDCPGVDDLADRFLRQGKCGQIVGRHGCGKTSLARAMVESMRSEFREIRFLVIRRSAKWGLHGETVTRLAGNGQGELRVVDGVERLSPVQRWCLVGHCRARRIPLLATTHRALPGLPVLVRLLPTYPHFARIVASLTRSSGITLEPNAVHGAYDRHAGDYREGLMCLYDQVQARLLAPAD